MNTSTALRNRQGAPLPCRLAASTVLSVLLLAACGGGGGSNGGGGSGAQSMSLSPNSISITATTVDPTPTAQVQVTIVGALPGSSYFVEAGSTTNTGIASVNVGNGSSAFAATGNVAINFKPPGSLGPGVYRDNVTISACYDQGCSRPLNNSPQTVTLQYTVTIPAPTVTSLSPASASAGSAGFALTVYGTEFTTQSVVNWNSAAISTTYVSSTQLTAQVSASNVSSSGTAPVTVSNPSIATSSAVTFTINPIALTSVSPSLIAAGGPAFTLNVMGSGFANSSVAQWNGSARPTTFVSATQLQAQITPADIASVGAASITVLTPTATGGPSRAVPVSVVTLPSWPASAHAVAYQVNPGHSGEVTFSAVTFPTSNAWTVDLGATASYALIADGKVFVTTTSSSGSNLYALDQTTGGTVWGPIAIAGVASPAYDNGVVFVSSGVAPAGVQGAGLVATGSVRAYEAATGALLWNTPMNGFDYSTTSAPTAMNGYVYVTGGNTAPVNDGTFALSQSTGAVTWFKQSPGAGNSSPAVGANGVYVDFTCGAYGYNPTTGQQLWSSQPRCASGIGGATSFLAGNTVFTPSLPASGYSGSMLDTATGASTGTYSAGVPPVFDAQTGYFVQANQSGGQGNLQAITLSSNTVKWTFTGESAVCSAMVISQYVIAEGCGGKLYGLDAATGKQLWLANPEPPSIWNFTSQLPIQGMAAGDGILVIPAGTKLIAYRLATNP